MKPAIILYLILACLLTSCYEPYITDTDTDYSALVVDGMITDDAVPYHIRLSYATPYNSGEILQPARLATVYITDNLGITYLFNEFDYGDYVSNPAEFIGIPGKLYTLHIITKEGQEYESEPQRLFPEVYPDSVYAEYDYKKILNNITGLEVIKHGANILVDIRTIADTLPRFRFTLSMVTQYFYTIQKEYLPSDFFYCWQTSNVYSDINITGEKHIINTVSINKHEVCFIEDYNRFLAITYIKGSSGPSPTDYYQSFDVHNRSIYLNQYTLNSEAYSYYKSMDEQLQSEGKIFDPIAVQLNGNIKCVSSPEKKALGFFETSSVSYYAYKVDFRNLNNDQPSLIKVPYILPTEPDGCLINVVPDFWVY